MNSFFEYFRLLCITAILSFLGFGGHTLAQTSVSTMSEEAKAGQKMQNPLYPQIQLPLTYNFNQKLGVNNGSQQTEIGFNPIIPVDINSDLQLIVNPMLTYNHNANKAYCVHVIQPKLHKFIREFRDKLK